MTEEILRRLSVLEKHMENHADQCATTVDRCALSMQQSATDIRLIQERSTHQNQLTERRLDHIQDLVETQHLVLNGNPRQDTKDRGLIGDVEQLKSSDARKKKLYWSMITAFVVVMASSLWSFITGSGKEDHGRSEPTETTVQKTSPDARYLHGDHRSRRRE
ncbi:hypothetical protein [Gimesia panareensis]|uniref:hypothetical protein n=1 Tax=Gimesia panareensis TaxID=2527978 RepID=UPI0011A4E6DA|nr:hypothetical protein [Gimesia panareensis]